MIKKFVKLIVGLFLFSLGNTFVYYGNIGLDPWNSFHSGISNLTGIDIGLVATIVSVFVLVLAILIGEKFGFGTVFDAILVGLFYQMFLDSGLFVEQTSFLGSGLYVLVGMEIICIGALLYMSAGLGAGPRDSLIVGLSKKLNLKMGVAKVILEVFVVFLAFLLGGKLGPGTVVTAFLTGSLLQLNIFLTKFNPKEVVHENILETIKKLNKGA